MRKFNLFKGKRECDEELGKFTRDEVMEMLIEDGYRPIIPSQIHVSKKYNCDNCGIANLLEGKSRMLDRCDKRVREIRQDNSLLMIGINKKIKEYQDLLDEIIDEYNKTGELALNIQTTYLQGVIKGLNISLDLLVDGVIF